MAKILWRTTKQGQEWWDTILNALRGGDIGAKTWSKEWVIWISESRIDQQQVQGREVGRSLVLGIETCKSIVSWESLRKCDWRGSWDQTVQALESHSGMSGWWMEGFERIFSRWVMWADVYILKAPFGFCVGTDYSGARRKARRLDRRVS